MEKEVKELENKLKLKVREYNQNEDEYQVENKFLNERLEKMCRMNEIKLKEIGQFCWDLEEQKKLVIEKNGEIELLERKKAVADRVIKNLQIEKDDLKEEVKAVCLENELLQAELKILKSDETNDVKDMLANQEDNIQKLLKEIEILQTENLVTKSQIEKTNEEKEYFKECPLM